MTTGAITTTAITTAAITTIAVTTADIKTMDRTTATITPIAMPTATITTIAMTRYGSDIETKRKKSFYNFVFFYIKAKQTRLIVRKLFLK
jgi:hypothetical protein